MGIHMLYILDIRILSLDLFCGVPVAMSPNHRAGMAQLQLSCRGQIFTKRRIFLWKRIQDGKAEAAILAKLGNNAS